MEIEKKMLENESNCPFVICLSTEMWIEFQWVVKLKFISLLIAISQDVTSSATSL